MYFDGDGTNNFDGYAKYDIVDKDLSDGIC